MGQRGVDQPIAIIPSTAQALTTNQQKWGESAGDGKAIVHPAFIVRLTDAIRPCSIWS
jgi:hypothetical protein